MIVSYFIGYSETLKSYRIYILAQQKILMTVDVKFFQDVRPSSSQVSPLVIERSEEVASPDVYSEAREESDLGVHEV